MEDMKSQLDLFLTEISIELLGNKIYDANGNRQDKLINLFKALPENHLENHHGSDGETVNSNDFLCSLGFQTDFSKDEKCMKDFLNDQLSFILEDANKTTTDNQNIIKCLRNYKQDQQSLVTDASDGNIMRLVEKGKLMTQLNRSRVKILNEKRLNTDKVQAMNEYYEREKNELLKLSMDTLRLMKYVLNDPRNEGNKGELIGYVHAMRNISAKNVENNSTPNIRAKPYRLQRKRESL